MKNRPEQRLAYLASALGYDPADFAYTKPERDARARADREVLYRRAAEVLIAPHLVSDERRRINRVAAFIGGTLEAPTMGRVADRLELTSKELRGAVNALMNGYTRTLRPRVVPSSTAPHEPLVQLHQDYASGLVRRPDCDFQTRIYTPTQPLEWAMTLPNQYPDLAEAMAEFALSPPQNPIIDNL